MTTESLPELLGKVPDGGVAAYSDAMSDGVEVSDSAASTVVDIDEVPGAALETGIGISGVGNV